jgi:hypothetical protein
MNELAILFFGFIIVSYFIGMWAGTKIKEPKIIIKQPKGEEKQKNLKKKMGLSPRRR